MATGPPGVDRNAAALTRRKPGPRPASRRQGPKPITKAWDLAIEGRFLRLRRFGWLIDAASSRPPEDARRLIVSERAWRDAVWVFAVYARYQDAQAPRPDDEHLYLMAIEAAHAARRLRERGCERLSGYDLKRALRARHRELVRAIVLRHPVDTWLAWAEFLRLVPADELPRHDEFGLAPWDFDWTAALVRAEQMENWTQTLEGHAYDGCEHLLSQTYLEAILLASDRILVSREGKVGRRLRAFRRAAQALILNHYRLLRGLEPAAHDAVGKRLPGTYGDLQFRLLLRELAAELCVPALADPNSLRSDRRFRSVHASCDILRRTLSRIAPRREVWIGYSANMRAKQDDRAEGRWAVGPLFHRPRQPHSLGSRPRPSSASGCRLAQVQDQGPVLLRTG